MQRKSPFIATVFSVFGALSFLLGLDRMSGLVFFNPGGVSGTSTLALFEAITLVMPIALAAFALSAILFGFAAVIRRLDVIAYPNGVPAVLNDPQDG
jgi:hypothetical protein